MFEQLLFPGTIEPALKKEVESLLHMKAVSRLWAGDASLWTNDVREAGELRKKLRWLELADKLAPYMERVVGRAASLAGDGLVDLVFVAMGQSNLAAEAIIRQSPVKLRGKFLLLDSINPASIRAIEKEIILERTLFVFASKSGKSIETHALLLYFLEKFRAAGVRAPGRHFVAVTEENSYLSELARTYEFRDVFLDPPEISGRYSSLIHFHLLLSAICGFAPAVLTQRTLAMTNACGPAAPPQQNPAVQLAAFLAAAVFQHRDRLIFLNAESIDYLVYQIGNLVGTSTGKQGQGLVPIYGQNSYPLEIFERSSVAVAIRMNGEHEQVLDDKIAQLQFAQIPLLSISLADSLDFGVELFKWEIATALLCARLGVNPFSDPDVQQGRKASTRLLEEAEKLPDIPKPTLRVGEGAIELRMEKHTRQEVSTLNLQEALRTFFALRNPDGYLAILPFTALSASVIGELRKARDQLVSALKIPVLITSGPRYLHSIGQLYKGGPPKGIFIILTTEPPEDIRVPGASYTFRQLELALALGDFDSLLQHKRPVLHLHLTTGIDSGLEQLNMVLKSALEHPRGAGP